jgi:hypothetical protein
MHIRFPQPSGLGSNPAAPEDVLVRVAHHPAGRSGLGLRSGQLPDAVVEVLLAHGGRSIVNLHGSRISPAMQRRIEEHPDPAIRDAFPAIRHPIPDDLVAACLADPATRSNAASVAVLTARGIDPVPGPASRIRRSGTRSP